MGNFNETFHRGHALNKTFFVHCSSSLFSQKKTILKESISFSNEKRSLSYSCWKGFALISVIWRFLLRWVNCFIDKAPPDCKDKHRNFQMNAFYIHLKIIRYSLFGYECYSTANHLSIHTLCIRNWFCCSD